MTGGTDPLVMTDMSGDDCDLRFAGVTKHYDEFSLEGASFGVPRGSVVGLVGRNGAGKTTLMKAAFGIIAPDGGRVEMFGADVAALADDELVRLRQRVGYVGAVMSYPPTMRVSEVVRLHELVYPDFGRQAFEELCLRMGLKASDRVVGDLSRGMGMKLQLACVIASGTELLVLDEPTAGLDPIVRDEVLDVLYAWVREGRRSILISSHITSDLERLADYLVMVEDGRIVLSCRSECLGRMGVVRLSGAAHERLVAPGIPHGLVRTLHRGPDVELLVLDRDDFAREHPEHVCERPSIDEVVSLVARGEAEPA